MTNFDLSFCDPKEDRIAATWHVTAKVRRRLANAAPSDKAKILQYYADALRALQVDELPATSILMWDLERTFGLPEHIGSPRGELPQSLPECVTYITKHLSDDLTLSEIATAVHRRKEHLARIFRRAYGMSIRDFIARERLRNAVAMINNGDKIEAAALLAGYRNRKTFYRHFKSTFGMSPSALRKG